MPSFETMRFGNLEFDEAEVLELPDGLIGLPHLRRWLMLDIAPEAPMRWLQSLDRPDFGVPVMPPFFFAEEYAITATTTARRRLAKVGEPDLVTLIIANIHPGGQRITGNLRAPLLLDSTTRRGAQLALEDDRLSTRQEIDYVKFALALASDSAENGLAAGGPAADAAAAEPADDAAETGAQTVTSGV
jgi:flagellar assembly factor FliW